MSTDNPYIPMPVTVSDVVIENEAKDLKTFTLSFDDPADCKRFAYVPGQFAEISLFGFGEAPIGIASSPTEPDILKFTVKRAGTLTQELHNSEPGRHLGVRGPLGNGFPWDRLKGRPIVIIGGGFAFTTLRSAVLYILDPAKRDTFGDLTVIYGARSPGELLYKDLLKTWEGDKNLNMVVTVDKGEPGWNGREGFVPTVLEQVAPNAENAIALVCGPPIMIKFTTVVLDRLGFDPANVYLSLEMRMKCGIGKCGRCNIGHKYVCIHGPVFSWEELGQLPPEF